MAVKNSTITIVRSMFNRKISFSQLKERLVEYDFVR